MHTELERFISKLKQEDALVAFHSVSEKDLRLPSAISIMVLYVAGKFCQSLDQTLQDLSGILNNPQKSNLMYDVVAFEMAAYCHYHLMRKYLKPVEDEDEDHNCNEDPLFRCLKNSAHLTNATIRGYAHFNLRDEFFINRAAPYSSWKLNRMVRDEAEQFQNILISSIKNGSPVGMGRNFSMLEDMDVKIGVPVAVGIFHQTYIKALDEMVVRLYQYARENPI